MAVRRSTSVCLSCQVRQSSIGRRRLTVTATQRVETMTSRPEVDEFVLECGIRDGKRELEEGGQAVPVNEKMRQWKLHSPVDELRDALLGFEALWRTRDLRLEVLRNLSNPWPEVKESRQRDSNFSPKPYLRLPKANDAPIPHSEFRQNLKEAMGSKHIRAILRAQLLRCEWPREVLRVMAVAMQNKSVAQNLSVLSEAIVRAMYRCRNNASDPEVLRALNIVIMRFDTANIPYEPHLLTLGLKFAARARSLGAMKKYLRLIRQTGLTISHHVFRSVIAKFSIGHRGLGEIRNGRWKRQQLLQVLTGFEDCAHLPPEQQYHLGSFLKRDDWHYLHGWVAVLARCKEADMVWHEWQLWKESSARIQPKRLASQSAGMTSRKRGDYWFVEQMAYSGDLERAWKMLEQTGVPFDTLKYRIKTRLLARAEFATVWDGSVREAMIEKYDRDLEKIERALGVKWNPGHEDGEGSHELIGPQEEALEALSSDNFKLEEEHGFPYYDEEGTIVSHAERALHDAEEKELAVEDGRL